MSYPLWPRELQHARLPCPSVPPGVCSDSCLSSWWCYWTISASATLFSSPLPSLFPSISIFSNESALRIRWPKYWTFSISPSNEYSGLISFRVDWFDLLAAQVTLKSLLQLHNLKASFLQCSAFLIVQLVCPYMATGKTISLTIQTFVGKGMSLVFNTLSWFVIALKYSLKADNLWLCYVRITEGITSTLFFGF